MSLRVNGTLQILPAFRKATGISGLKPPEDPKILEAPFEVNDVEDAPHTLIAERQQLYRTEGIRSLLVIPMRIHNANSGTMVFYCRSPHHFSEAEIRRGSALANMSAAAIEAAELYREQVRMRAEAEESERRHAFLGEATALLGSSLDYRATLAQVARLAVPHMADWCAVDVLEDDGLFRQLTLVHAPGSRLDLIREVRREYSPDQSAETGIAQALRSGKPVISTERSAELLLRAARGSEQMDLMNQAGFQSLMCVPAVARGRTLGAITFVAVDSGRKYGPADLALAEHLGRRAGLAIDNALLYETARRERAAAEASLEASSRSEMRFRRLMESGIIGILLGEEDRVTEANDVFLEMLGYNRRDVAEGKLRLSTITAPEQVHLNDMVRDQMLRTGSCAPFEREYVRKDGTRLPVLAGATMLDSSPHLTWVRFAVDLSERKRLEERLRESQKLESIGILAGGIAHDFNNLLTGIMGNASLALDDLPADSSLRPTLDNVIRASERAAHLTQQLLAYSGRGRFVIQPVDLSALIREIAELLRMSIPKKVHLRLDLAPKLPPVQGDSSQMQQLIMNLVLNGAEAIGDNIGTVQVTTGVQQVDEDYIQTAMLREGVVPGRYVYLEVHDTGCGMDDATLPRIFDPFFTTKFTGRGLGLAAAIGIVRGHGGDIRVYSTPGHGSAFKILIPAAAAEPASPEAVPSAQELSGSGTVLIVDDEAVVVKAAQAALERYGYRVLAAADGQEAVEIFQREVESISLVLLDMTMPVMSGEEALAALKAIRPDVRVVVSSGYNAAEAIRRFTGTGAAAFIQKPYRSAQLAEKIKAVLEGRETGLGTVNAEGAT